MMRRLSQWLIFLAAVALLVAVLFFIRQQVEIQANRPAPIKESVEYHTDVTVVTVKAGSYDAKLIGYGTASPHFKLKLTAQVTGRVDELSPVFESGNLLEKGELLATLEESDYRTAVASAKKELSDARLALLEEKRKGLQAKAEWEASGLEGEPASELVLRKPQLAVAKAAVAKAEASLSSATKDLEQTKIIVPFDSVVIVRHIAPGSYVQPGTEIATLYSVDRIDIPISLSAEQWEKLPKGNLLKSGQWPVALTNAQNIQSWSGRVLRVEKHLDEQSRQRTLTVAVDRPLDLQPPMLPGTFVKATIIGRRLKNIWRLPSSAFSQKGEIWYLESENKLASFSAKIEFSDGDYIYVAPPVHLAKSTQRVLAHPLVSYLQGMAVNPVEETEDE